MTLVRYTYPNSRTLAPFARSPWSGLESEIDRLFQSTLGDFAGTAATRRVPVDLYEDKDNTYVRAELPGLNREDISLELIDGYLSINGDRKTTDDDGKVTETFSLNRSIAMPQEVQADKIAATYENGVLAVTLPKHEEAKPKKITIAVN